EREKREKTRGRKAPTSGGAYARVSAPVAPFLSIHARFPTVCVDLLSYPIYFRIWTRVLSPEEICLRRVSNGGNLPFSGFVGLFREAEAPLVPPSPFKFPGVEASSALRRRQNLREVEALSALRRRYHAPRGEGVLYLSPSTLAFSSSFA
ncbi:unnamed protein product, partial [Brassica rapa subsp. trilocularis]